VPEVHQLLRLTLIRPSPTNPRTIFDDAYLAELAASILKVGVLHAVIVRQLGPEVYELVIGECRWRACKLAGLDLIPAKIVDWTDDQVTEAQHIENVQRKDLHPIEEADSYATLLKLPDYSVERIADRTGRPAKHVEERLRLAKLTPAVRKEFVDNKFGIGIALLIARIPGEKQQAEAAKAAAIGREGEGFKDADGNYRRQNRPYTITEFQALVLRTYTLRLATAPFPIDDATLRPEAGACSSCPKRTGNQQAMFSDVKNADTCTDVDCFDKKKSAFFGRRAAEHKSRGGKVLDNAAAKNVFSKRIDHRTGNTETKHDARLVALDEELPYNLAGYGSPANGKTWAQVLGKAKDELPIVLAKDPESGALRELVDRADATTTAKKTGKLASPAGRARGELSPTEKKHRAERKAQLAKERIGHRAFERLLKRIMEAGAPPPGKAVAWWRAHVDLLMSSRLNSGERTVGEMITGKEWRNSMRPQLTKYVDGLKTVDELAGFAAAILVADVEGYGRRLADSDARDMAKVCGADWATCLKAASDAAKAELKIKEAKRAARAKGGGRG
jgi:ParB/RepB/Spo0J family partition protein